MYPVLSSPHVSKVMHDCREDVSALVQHFQACLRGVVDTLMAYVMKNERRESAPAFQVGLNDALMKTLGVRNWPASRAWEALA